MTETDKAGRKKTIKKLFFFVIILIFTLGIGYYIGHKIGRTYGAQQYTKLVWSNNDTQISPSVVFNKMNLYREKGRLEPFQKDLGLCALAELRAEESWRKVGLQWDPSTQSYIDISLPKDLHETELNPETSNKLCPNCVAESVLENAYISVRPETCLNALGKEICKGGEGFGIVENYTDRVVNGWIESPPHKATLLSSRSHACVGSYGGTVMLEAANVN